MSGDNSETPVSAGDQPIHLHLSYYAVLCLDLLGQREAISALEDLTLLRDNQPEYYRRFGEAARKVWHVRGFLEYRLDKEMGAALASAGYPVPRVTIQMFADTVMVYFPWDEKNPNAFVALYSLLVATAETMIIGLASEVPIRGGLEVHAAIDFNEANIEASPSPASVVRRGDIWGPAPKLAYELAETDHNYMRVRVGQGVPGLLIESAKWMSSQLQADPHKAQWFGPPNEVAKKAVRMIARDPVDNHPIVDYLGKAMAETLAPETLALVGKAVVFAKSTYERLRANHDGGVADKYGKLMSYIAARREPNGIAPALSES